MTALCWLTHGKVNERAPRKRINTADARPSIVTSIQEAMFAFVQHKKERTAENELKPLGRVFLLKTLHTLI